MRGIGNTKMADIFSSIINFFVKEVNRRVRKYIVDVASLLIKTVILAIMGVEFIILGALFLLISLVKYASIYIPVWAAWLLGGFIALIIGCLIMLAMLVRKS